MKKKILYCLLIILVVSSCKREENTPGKPACLQLSQHQDWTTTKFKGDLTIQFPDQYEGGLFGIEGPIFNWERLDNNVKVQYAFCGPLLCVEYGDTLQNSLAKTLTTSDNYYQIVHLTQRLDLCDDLVTLGIYYYNQDSLSIGKLYWLVDNVFRQSVSVYYENAFQTEVEQILQTIKRK